MVCDRCGVDKESVRDSWVLRPDVDEGNYCKDCIVDLNCEIKSCNTCPNSPAPGICTFGVM